MTIVKYSQNDINNKKGKTDWKRLAKQTDSQIEKAALSDKDTPLISDYDANRFKPAKQMRHKLPT